MIEADDHLRVRPPSVASPKDAGAAAAVFRPSISYDQIAEASKRRHCVTSTESFGFKHVLDVEAPRSAWAAAFFVEESHHWYEGR